MKFLYVGALLIIVVFLGWSANLLFSIQGVWNSSSEQHQLRTNITNLADAWRNLSRPGNDVLENYDVATHRDLLSQYLSQFEIAREMLRQNPGASTDLNRTLRRLDIEKAGLTEKAGHILRLAEERERLRLGGATQAIIREKETEAASTMARMDQGFQNGLDLLLRADVYIVAEERRLEYLQQQNFKRLYIMLVVTLLASALALELLRRTMRQREALRHGTAQINTIVNNVVDGIITVDQYGAIESFNPTASRMFGYSADEVIGQHFSTLLDDPSEDRTLEYLHPFSRGDRGPIGRGEYEEVGRRKDGGTFPMELATSRVQLGKRWISIQIVRDITERKRAEEKLRQAASVFENTTEGILITDAETRIQSVNPAFTAITGYALEEVVGESPAILQSGRQNKEFYRKMWKSLNETGHWQGEIWNKRKSGEVYPQWLNISAVRDNRGKLTNYVGVTWDISEMKASERMKDEFIATVSHELRTPLTSIRGSLGLIAGGVVGELPERARNLVEIAYSNSERLVRLINDILDLEKIEAGKMKFHLRPLEILPLVNQAIEANVAYGEQLGVSFELQTDLPAATVVGDSDRLIQVLTNLLSNAAKFSPRGETVVVGVERRDNSIRVSVTDRGPGVPEKFREHLFKRFAQADASDTRQKGGSGLGLSICRLIVEKLDGRISYTTDPGVATTFYFELPELRRAGAAQVQEPDTADDVAARRTV